MSSSSSILPQRDDLWKLFEQTSTKSIIPVNRELISINENQTLGEAVSILARHKILSAPVFKQDNTCAGVLDSLTIIDYLNSKKTGSTSSERINIVDSTPPQTPRRNSLSLDHPLPSIQVQRQALETGLMNVEEQQTLSRQQEAEIQQLANTNVLDVLQSSHRSMTIPFYAENPLSILIDLFASGVHR